MNRTIIKIDENRCTGCGACVAGCHGGALQIIDGKAKIINQDFCDGLGACIGTCPVGAIEMQECKTEELPKEMPCCNSSFEMQQFPIQLRLVNPNASFLKNSDLILAADCTAFVYSNFQNQFMKNKSIVIACPKLDNASEYYVEKLTAMIDNSFINTLTVILMEVPCCGGLLLIAKQALANAKRKIPVKKVVIGTKGGLLIEEWV